MRILVLVNPAAGNGRTLKLLPKIRKMISESPHDFRWRIPKSPDEMCAEIDNAYSAKIDCILLMGGDGTVHEALPAFREIDLPFGLLPCGRGNDFARNIGLSPDIKRNCHIPAEPYFHEIDLPVVDGIPFGSVVCTGFDAEVNRLARDKMGLLGGTPGYVVCVIRALRSFKPFEIKIKVDGFHWQGRVMMTAVSNGPYYGGGMNIAPGARMNDGKFEVCIIKELSKWELIREFPKVFRGAHVNHPKVILKSGKRVEMKSGEYREIFADGEYVGKLPAVCTMEDRKIQIMLPYPASRKPSRNSRQSMFWNINKL